MEVIEKFKIAFQASPGPVVLVDPDGNIVLTNSAMDFLFEYPPNGLIGEKVDVLVPPAAREHHPDLRNAYFEVPSNRNMGTGRDLYGVSKSGRMIPLEIGLNYLDSEDGVWVLASILDITERKKEEEKLRMAVDAASSAMVMTTQTGNIVLTNSQASETFGYSRDEMLNQNVEMLVPERVRRRHVVYRTSFASAPARRAMGAGRELFGLRKDGTEFPLEIGLTPFSSHDGDFIMATIIDITERRENQRAINSKNAELEKLNEELMQFAYSASHDLKAPLSTIQGLLSFVEKDLDSGDVDEARSNVTRSLQLTAKLASLVEDVLNLAKSDHLQEEPEEVNLLDAITASLQGLDGAIIEDNVEVSVDVASDISLTTKPARLTQILDNLIGNAVKFSDPTKSARLVEIVAASNGQRIEFSVSDNGVGIPEKRHGDVFKMFTRFGGHRNHGSGLGLSLVKKAVDSMGGDITFESSKVGSRFTVSIPR